MSERTASAAPDDVIGRHWSELETPALLLDVDVAGANIARMAKRIEPLPVELRPHVKVHKSPELARMQIDAGAIGLTVATLGEAIAMQAAGLDDVMIANEVVAADKVSTLAAAAAGKRLSVCVDDPGNLAAIAAAARSRGSEVGILVDVDTGMARCGVRRPEQARELASLATELDGVHFVGVSGYEGHCMGIADPGERTIAAGAAMDLLVEVVEAIRGDGAAVPVVSAGGTGTFEMTGGDARITEVQAGSYVVMDVFHSRLVPGFEVALTVAATVISRQGERVVLDTGHKAISATLTMPRLVDLDGEPDFINEEHFGFDTARPDPRVGDPVRLISGYAPLTVNLYDRYHVLSAAGVVVDVWPVRARYGPPTVVPADESDAAA